MEKCENNHVIIYTSILSVVEVSFSRKDEQHAQNLSHQVEDAINELWAPNSKIRKVEFHDLIALRAKEIMRSAIEMGWSIKPADAIHLSTAKSIRADEFHTYDIKLNKKHAAELKTLLGFTIKEPHKEPSLFDQLNDTKNTQGI